MGHQSGFTLIESLFSLMVTAIIMVLLCSICLSFRALKCPAPSNADIDLFGYQMQQTLLIAEDVFVEAGELHYAINEEEYTLIHDQDRLVKKSGYEILLFNVEAVDYEIGDFVTIKIKREDKVIEKVIGLKRLNYD